MIAEGKVQTAAGATNPSGVAASGRRAWIELDMAALAHNVCLLRKRLPDTCELMAVVKANAYGHGDLAVARALNGMGVSRFAVATLEEALRLRRGGVHGEILILGYTDPPDASLLARYHLTQTVVDMRHAAALSTSGRRVQVQIALDTGMHRLGIDSEHISEIERVFACDHLTMTGVFSHLCASDSPDSADEAFTRLQLRRFERAVNRLRADGYDPGRCHIQASGGMLRYSGQSWDCARAGIALYGVGGTPEVPLRPVLSLRSRVSCVRTIEAGETAGYGRAFRAGRTTHLAAVSIGYADGVPRQLSGRGEVLIRGRRAPVAGRVCMDQMLVDVTDVPGVAPGDVVTLIGRDGKEMIRCEEVAEWCGTIANEILSRLGARLERLDAGKPV